MDHFVKSRLVTAAIVAITGLSAGCGSGGGAHGEATQVVAKVNGRELTVSQLNQELAAMNAPDTGSVATQKALKELIDEELLVQAASRAKLDHDPAVQLDIDATQREILAKAYEERHVYPSGPIDDAELHKFYDTNSALFSARRIYHGTAFNIDAPELPATLLAGLIQVHTVDALRSALARNDVKFQQEDVTRAPETLPLELVPRLVAAKTGDVVVATTETGSPQLLFLTRIDVSPVGYGQASNAIRLFLQARRNEAALRTHLQQLQSAAQIQYVGGIGPLAAPGQ